MVKVTVIFDNEVSAPARDVGIDLSVHSRPYSPLVTAVALDDPSDPRFEGGNDHDGFVHKTIVPGFE